MGDEDDYYCERHNVETPHYEGTDDPHCIKCREEQRRDAQRQHMVTRDRTMEPW